MPTLIDNLLRRFGFSKAQNDVMTPVDLSSDRAERPINIEDLISAYGVHVWVYACVYTIATSGASVPVRLMRRNAQGELTEVKSHPLADLLVDPNPDFSAFELFESTFAFLELTGNCYWLKERNALGFPVRLQVLRPDRTKVIGAATGVTGYEYKVDARTLRFEPKDIVHFRYFNPNSDWYGQGALSPAQISATIDLYAQNFDKTLLKRFGIPAAVVQPEGNRQLGDQQIRNITAQIRQLFSGGEKSNRIGVMPTGLKWQEISFKSRELALESKRKFAREEILAAFGVPPVMVGLLEHASYANAREQKQTFWAETMQPKIVKINGRLNSKLAREFGEDLEIIHDLIETMSMLDDQGKDAEIDDRLVRAGILTINEVRARRNLEPVPWGDEPPRQGIPLPLVGGGKGEGGFVRELIGRARLLPSRALALPRNDSSPSLLGKGTGDRLKAPRDDLDRVLSNEEWESLIKELTTPVYVGTFTDRAKKIARDLSVGIDLQLIDQRAVAYAKLHAAELVGNINRATRERLHDLIVRSEERGESLHDLIQRIERDESALFDATRAERIARTETIGSANAGTMEGMHEAEVEKKFWIAALDERTRETHAEAHVRYSENPIPLEEDFEVGDTSGPAPGDLDDAEEIINCRCTVGAAFGKSWEPMPFGSERHETHWKSFITEIAPFARKFQKQAQRILREQKQAVLEALRG